MFWLIHSYICMYTFTKASNTVFTQWDCPYKDVRYHQVLTIRYRCVTQTGDLLISSLVASLWVANHRGNLISQVCGSTGLGSQAWALQTWCRQRWDPLVQAMHSGPSTNWAGRSMLIVQYPKIILVNITMVDQYPKNMICVTMNSWLTQRLVWR